jgi:iron complex outermembrane receptor protein
MGVSTVALTAALALGAVPAAAQTHGGATSTGADGGNTVGEVVVTAQFREQNLQKTPIAITAVNAQMLEQRSQKSIYEVAAQAPNVTLKPAPAAFGPSLQASIRGVGQFDFNYALEPGVGMYVDDVYYSTLTGSIFDLLDLDRVEILRGPQGTLAGKNSIGGAVKLYSKKPNGENSGYVEGTYGSLNRIDARAGADFALVPDKLFVRLAAVTRHHDGYVTRLDYACTHPGSGIPTYVVGTGCKLGDEGGQSMSALRASLRWLASENVEVNLIADATKDDSEVQASTGLYAHNLNPALTARNGGIPYDCRFVPSSYLPGAACDPVIHDPYVTYSTFQDPTNAFGALAIPAVNTLKSWGVSNTIDWKLSDSLALKSITAFRYYTGDFAEDTDASPLSVELVMNHVFHRSWQQELRLNGNFGTAIDYTVGGFYFWQHNQNSNRVDLPYAGLDFLGNDPVESDNKSGFAHAVWHITDRLNLTGGVRYTDESKTYTFSRMNPDGSFNPILSPLTGQVGKFSGSRWDWRADLDYHFTDDLMGYAEFSTGYKGGGVNPRPFVPSQVQPFGPETLNAYEIGLKSTLFDRKMRLNLSGFYNEYNGIQLTLLSCPQFSPPIPGFPCALPINGGDAHVKGFEAETEIHPVAGLEMDGSVSYIDFQYVASSLNPQTGILPGMVTPQTPKWKWSAGVQYEVPVMGIGSITPRIDANYQAAVFDNAANSAFNRVPAYTVFNARLTWRNPGRDLEASLEITNFTDKLYYFNVFDLHNLAGYVNAQPAQPREWAVTVRKTF